MTIETICEIFVPVVGSVMPTPEPSMNGSYIGTGVGIGVALLVLLLLLLIIFCCCYYRKMRKTKSKYIIC